MNKKRTYNGNFDFSDFIKEALKEEKAKAGEGWGRAELGRVPIPEFNLHNMSVGVVAHWTAPIGYNNYLTKGNFKGCRPIIKPGATINARVFEPINFVMV